MHQDHKPLNNKYDFKQVEADLACLNCLNNQHNLQDNHKVFSIVLPPPNVTGNLHLGHAFNAIIQDILIRYHQLHHYQTVWMPGLDPAGIATQVAVEKHLAKTYQKKITDYQAHEFIEEILKWTKEKSQKIKKQWLTLGLALNYEKEQFLLSASYTNLVQSCFVQLYEAGLIYHDQKIINLDTTLKTAISDIEVRYETITGKLYFIKYYLANQSTTFLTVATTRPETMFADSALFVHPLDTKYTEFINQHAINPVNNQLIPILTDEYVDMQFGSGVMKCTPAHDVEDFKLGKKYHLAMNQCMNNDGTMNHLAGIYQGISSLNCRDLLMQDLEKRGLLSNVESYQCRVGFSERTNTIIEPFLSKQWFLKTKLLAEQVIKNQANETTKVQFFPKKFEKVLLTWLHNIEDWCISRQIVWGHRIPVWFNKLTLTPWVSLKPPTDLTQWTEGIDVLDTWFASGLWPMIANHWPDQTSWYYKKCFPTDVLVTSYDIIFFWIARMLMLSIFFTQQIPFKNVIIHGLLYDSQGRKMSKTLQNGIEPNEIIDKYGVDSLRWWLITNTNLDTNITFDEKKIKNFTNFINKLWDVTQYVIEQNYQHQPINDNQLTDADLWILQKLNNIINNYTTQIKNYNFTVICENLKNFIEEDFCNWYIKLIKVQIKDNFINNHWAVTKYVLDNILRLLYPLIPFVTLHLYKYINPNQKICNSSFPTIKSLLRLDEYIFDVIDIAKTINQRRIINHYHKFININHDLNYEPEVIEMINVYLAALANIKLLNNNKDANNSEIIEFKNGKLFIPINSFDELNNITNIDLLTNKFRYYEKEQKILDELKNKKVSNYENKIKNCHKWINELVTYQQQWLTKARLEALTITQIRALTKEQMCALTKKQMLCLTFYQITGFRKEQIWGLTKEKEEVLNNVIKFLYLTKTYELTNAEEKTKMEAEWRALLSKPSFSKEQIERFTKEKIRALNQEQIWRLTGEQIGCFSIEQIKALTLEQFGWFTLEQFGWLSYKKQWLTNEQLEWLKTWLAKKWTKETFEKLTKEKIKLLQREQIGALTKEQLGWLKTQIEWLTPTQNGSLELKTIEWLNQEQIEILETKFSHLQLKRSLNKNQIQALNKNQIQALTKKNINEFTSNQIQAFNINQLQSFKPEQISALNDKQIEVLTVVQIKALTLNQVKILTSQQIQLISSDKIIKLKIKFPSLIKKQSFSDDEVKALLPIEILILSEKQIQALTYEQIQALTYEQIGALTKMQISYLTLTQLGSLNINQLQWLSPKQLEALCTEEKVRALNIDKIKTYTSNQILTLNTNQIKMLINEQTQNI